MDKLYEVKIKRDGEDVIIFCTHAGINSDGLWLMEEKATKQIHLAARDDVTEVLPHTVAVQYVAAGSKAYHFFAPKGAFAENDLLLMEDGQFARVSKTDTRSRSATRSLSGWKLAASFVAAEIE